MLAENKIEKKIWQKIYLFVKIWTFWKKMCFFLRRRKCSIVRSYEKFIEICREFVEIMDLRYNFGSGCAKNVLKWQIMRAHKKSLQILNHCIKTFPMRYQRPLYDLFHPDLSPPDPPKFHYSSAPWVAQTTMD